MSDQDLRQQLGELTIELQALPPDSSRRLLIQALINDIETQMGGDPVDTLPEQVESAVSSFEVEHPRIAAILHNIMVTLTSMGV